MITLPPEPSAKDPISASFMRAIMRYIRANTLLNGRGYKTKRGPNGTTLVISPGGKTPPSAALPWSFSCTEAEDPENPGETVRTGGWTNCILQLGYDLFLHSPDVTYVGNRGYPYIQGTDTNEDGDYYVECNLVDQTALIRVNDGSILPNSPHDPANNIVRIWIGEVKDGKLVSGIHHHPVVYSYA